MTIAVGKFWIELERSFDVKKPHQVRSHWSCNFPTSAMLFNFRKETSQLRLVLTNLNGNFFFKENNFTLSNSWIFPTSYNPSNYMSHLVSPWLGAQVRHFSTQKRILSKMNLAWLIYISQNHREHCLAIWTLVQSDAGFFLMSHRSSLDQSHSRQG